MEDFPDLFKKIGMKKEEGREVEVWLVAGKDAHWCRAGGAEKERKNNEQEKRKIDNKWQMSSRRSFKSETKRVFVFIINFRLTFIYFTKKACKKLQVDYFFHFNENLSKLHRSHHTPDRRDKNNLDAVEVHVTKKVYESPNKFIWQSRYMVTKVKQRWTCWVFRWVTTADIISSLRVVDQT